MSPVIQLADAFLTDFFQEIRVVSFTLSRQYLGKIILIDGKFKQKPANAFLAVSDLRADDGF